MDICNRVKIFKSTNLEKLENAINNWFKDNPVLLVDVKFNHVVHHDWDDHYSAMIIYQ